MEQFFVKFVSRALYLHVLSYGENIFWSEWTGKRNAEVEIEKAVSAKKQKTVTVKVEPVKKQPPPKKVESSSSEEESSDSEEEVPLFFPFRLTRPLPLKS